VYPKLAPDYGIKKFQRFGDFVVSDRNIGDDGRQVLRRAPTAKEFAERNGRSPEPASPLLRRQQ
jgi:hypothetical protein